MKKRLAVLFGLVLILAGFAATSIYMASEDAAFEPVDLTMTFAMPDGSTRSLDEIIALTAERFPTETVTPADPTAETTTDAAQPQNADDFVLDESLPLGYVHIAPDLPSKRIIRTENGWRFESNPDDVYGLASIKMDEMRAGTATTEEVLTLLRSVPESHPMFGHAQRHIGWSILTKQQKEPGKAVPFVTRALAADPLDNNAWEDAARVYASTLGFNLDFEF